MLRLAERQSRIRYRVMPKPSHHTVGVDSNSVYDAEMRLIREMKAIYALHDLYQHYVDQPVPQPLIDLVAFHEPEEQDR